MLYLSSVATLNEKLARVKFSIAANGVGSLGSRGNRLVITVDLVACAVLGSKCRRSISSLLKLRRRLLCNLYLAYRAAAVVGKSRNENYVRRGVKRVSKLKLVGCIARRHLSYAA